jgi:AAA domain/Transcriptional regulator, AbiEi antitoxin
MTIKASPEFRKILERGDRNFRLVLPQDSVNDAGMPTSTSEEQQTPPRADVPGDRPREELQWKNGTFTGKQLQDMEFSPISFLVENIIPDQGVTLMCAKPKFGKSWLAYDLCIGCTTDRFILGEIKPAQGDVLYLALEDSRRRLQRRMAKLVPTGTPWPSKLTLKTEWRRLHEGGLDDIRAWHTHTKNNGGKPIAVVIDVLEKVRKAAGGKQIYAADYEAITGLTRLAADLGIAIIVLHHTRKMASDDLMETVSGSFGITGAADTILVMAHKASGAVLDVRGRDVESSEFAIELSKETCRWRILGVATEVHASGQRRQVLASLEGAAEGLAVTEIVVAAQLSNRKSADTLLHRMAKAGEIERVKRGVYGLVGTSAKLATANTGKKGKKERSGEATEST